MKDTNVSRCSCVPEGNFRSLFRAMAGDTNCFCKKLLRRRGAALLGTGLVLPCPGFGRSDGAALAHDHRSGNRVVDAHRGEGRPPPKLQGRVSYFDPTYKLFWIERDDHVGTYVQLSGKPPAMRTDSTL